MLDFFIYISEKSNNHRKQSKTHLEKAKKLRKIRTKCRIYWTIQLNIVKNPKQTILTEKFEKTGGSVSAFGSRDQTGLQPQQPLVDNIKMKQRRRKDNIQLFKQNPLIF